MDAPTSAIIVSLISLIGTILLAVLSQGKQSKTDAVKEENRITKIEANLLTGAERKCLIENTLKITFLFDYFVGDAASKLKNPPHIDAGLAIIQNHGFDGYISLSDEMKEDIQIYTEKLLNDKRVGSDKKQKARLIQGLRSLEEKLQEIEVGTS